MKKRLAAAFGAAAFLAMTAAFADSVVEQNMEQRFQLDFHVPDAALKKFLPQGWEAAVATQGPAKDANLRLIFIDRLSVMGLDGKPAGKGTSRIVYLAVPVKQTAGMAAGQMIIAGLSDDTLDKGPFGVYKPATQSTMNRTTASENGAVMVTEDWNFIGANGEYMQLHVKYQRAPANKGGGEVKFYNPVDPAKYVTFKTEQGLDITRNLPTNPPDRVKEFTYKAGGGAGLTQLFDGSEKVLSWDSFPWYNRTVIAP